MKNIKVGQSFLDPNGRITRTVTAIWSDKISYTWHCKAKNRTHINIPFYFANDTQTYFNECYLIK